MKCLPSFVFFIILTAQTFSCRTDTPQQGEPPFDRSEVTEQVMQHIWEFHTADTSMNARGVIDLLWPEYTMLGDGKRMTYEDVVAGSTQFMNGLRLFHTVWSDVRVIPISQDAALSSFIFRDSIISKSGELTRAQGPTTFLWERREGQWKIIFGDADHHPLESH